MRVIDSRIGVLFACFLILLVGAIARAAWVQGVQGAGLSADAVSQHSRSEEIPGLRGAIVDRTGRNDLAVSEDAVNVFVTPYQVKDTAKTARKLAPLLHMTQAQVARAMESGSSGFAYLAHEVDLPTAAKIKHLDLPGVGMEPAERRVYPQGDLASQVIGSVGTDGQGLTGLEGADNSLLAGSNGQMQVIVDGLGKELARHTSTPAEQGQDLKLTIDAAIQAKTEDVLAQTAQTFQPDRATAIVMNPNNGQVLAMANWPSGDPADLSNATSAELGNSATGFTYEPGSTFKAFTVAGALEDGKVTPHTSFYLPTELQVADRTITDAEARGPRRGPLPRSSRSRPTSARTSSASASASGGCPTGSTCSASASRPASTIPARSRASSRRSRSGPARRSATCRSARGFRSPRSRWPPATRRLPTAGSCGHRGSF